jgi:uncharacterized membrane protein YfhO
MTDILGVTGAVLLLLAYFMSTTKRWQTHSLVYQLSNLIAMVFLIIYNLEKLAYVNVGINVVWASVAILGLVFMGEHQRRHRKMK